jgi:Erv1 / Alr family
MSNSRKKRTISKDKIYTKDDFNSGDGMLTAVWGPPMWHFLHTMSFNYPVEPSQDDKTHYMNFVKSLVHVLPCKYCRMNLKKNLKKMPITIQKMESRETFSKYIYDLHEYVNKMLGKKSGLSYNDVQERYEHFRARCVINPKEEKSKVEISKGCTEPLFGTKSKCLIRIVPVDEKKPTFEINKMCIRTRGKKQLTIDDSALPLHSKTLKRR